tara:strand:- start:2501 stop:2899 length:399 start_codon:yes stop_codon:yes gene_type:complete
MMKEDTNDILLGKVNEDLISFKRKTSIFSVLAVVFIIGQISSATISTFLTVGEYYENGFIFSAMTALLVTVEGALAVRERAASSFNSVHRLEGIRFQIIHADAATSPLWEEYTAAHANRKINYLEGIFMPWF